ncbi:SDR family NAD(P)-dependent oxidoreductase [Pseudoduganella rhizocola]|uniref:SDR family NAD(P)-dependent oxidoreductase n=1 Tax=Pseudoduganella rhizocola TaxID=3382643 RepID=UPI0038B5EADC
MNSTQKTALVTGGSRGIGAGIVRRLAADGYAVAFTYNASAGPAQALADDIAATGGKALAIQADSADAGAIHAAVEHTVETFGRLDVLVNSAGIYKLATVDEFPLDDFDRMLAVNVRAPFAAIQAASRVMREGGRIITIGSMAGQRVGFPGAGVYGMTKTAVATMVRGAAIDLAKRGITVNNVQPGPTETDMTPGTGEMADRIRSLVPLGRMASPAEIADMVAYLVRPETSFITGASFTIDGGMSA